MATLNLSGYEITNGSIIGYSNDSGSFDVVGGDSISSASDLFSQYTQVTNKGNTWSVNLTEFDSVLSGFADVSGKNWDITVNGSTTTDFELGSGADSVNVTGGKDETVIRTGEGKDAVTVATGVTGGLVDLGAGADIISIGSGASVSVAGGDGKDSIDVTGLGAGTVTLTDFNATEDTLVVGTKLAASNLGADGTVTIGTSAVKVNETNGFYELSTDQDSLIAWSASTSGSSSTVDLSSSTKAVTIYGRNDSTTSDTLLGGTKNDTIYAGHTDYVYGGAGKDSIILNSTTGTQESVGLNAAGGKDTVDNFEFGKEGDAVVLTDNVISEGFSLKKSGTSMEAKQGSATLTLNGIAGTATGAETVVNVQDSTGTTYDVDFVSGAATVSDSDSIHKVYYADSSKKTNSINFSTVDDSLVIDLGNTGLQSNTGDAIYYGAFATVTGGSDTTVLMGAAGNKETLVAGTGATTLWGGSGKTADVLVGSSDTDNAVSFFYTADNGKDTVKSGRWGSDDTSDVLYLSNVEVTSIKSNGSNVTFSAGTGNSLTVEGLRADTAVKWTTDGENIQLAKIGNSSSSNTWTYEEDVTMYLGGKSNSLTVSEDAQVWLAGTEGKTYTNVTKVDASRSSDTVVLAGNGDVSETLIGGRGENSLWGGAGSANDTLTGSSAGTTTFYFGKGEGNDVITATSSEDKVLLYNVNLDDIANIDNSTSGQLKFTLNDGATLTIKGMSSSSSVSQFQLGDGSTWTYSNKTWTQNS
ncbi:MAG: hypothetical protein IJU00_13605 [Selenomonas sp.]|nr:hypothetical protein [Selenomonas sp.]